MCDICRLQTGRLYIVLPIPSSLNNLTEVLFWLTGVLVWLTKALVWLTKALVWLTEVLVWLAQARVCKSAVCICRTPRRSWVRFPSRSKDFFFTSCGSLIPITGANAQWVIHGLNWHFWRS